MSKVLGFIKRRKVLLIVLTVIIVIIALIVNFISSAASQVTALMSQPSVTPLVLQDIENVIVASGQTSSTDSRMVMVTSTPNTTGSEIIAMNVSVGDSVSEGEVLAQLDTEAVYDSIESAQENYTDSKTDISNQNAITNHNLAVASDSVTDAQTAYNDAKATYTADQQKIADQKAVLNNSLTAQTAASNSAITAILSSWAAATSSTATPDMYMAELNNAYNALSSLDKLDTTNVTTKAYNDVAAEQTKIQSISAEIAKLDAESQALLSSFSTQETQLLNSIEQAQNSLTQQTLQAQSTNSSNSRQLDNLNEGIADAQEGLDDTYIRAPISGVVTEVNYDVGDSVGTAAVCVVQDLANLEIYTTVASYDVVKLTEGMQAIITTDSTGTTELMGTITEISPIAVDTSGSFSVKISVDGTDENLRAGVPAQVKFMIESSADTYAVPIDAVIEQDGSQYIYVYDTMPTAEQFAMGEQDGRRMIQVATGLESDYLIEIISAELTDGMLVLDDPMGYNVADIAGFTDGAIMVGPTAGGAPAGGGGPAGGR